jgi:hypothetical protein
VELKHKVAIGAAAAGVLFIGAGLAGAFDDPPADKPAASDTSDNKKGEQQDETSPEPEKKATPEERLTEALEKNLGRSNRSVKRVSVKYNPDAATEITVAANSQFTEGLTKTAARRDVVESLRAVKTTKAPVTVVVVSVTYPMTGEDAETEEMQVMRLGYSADALDDIDLDAIDQKRIEERADGATLVLPAFRY